MTFTPFTQSTVVPKLRRPPRSTVRIRLLLVSALLSVVPATAKRSSPAPVPPIIDGSVEYSAPPDQMGFVVATDVATHRELWHVRIYTIHVNPLLERDVQDVFITALSLDHGTLVIVTEHKDRYTLELATHRVTKRK